MTPYFKHKIRSKKYISIAFKVLLGIIAAFGFALLLGYGIMWLWNWLMPDIFGLMQINYWQAVGLFILAKILFGSFGDHESKKPKGKSHDYCKIKNYGASKSDFSKWKFYDKFWEEEGENAYKEYVKRTKVEE